MEVSNEAVKLVPYTYWNKANDDQRAKLDRQLGADPLGIRTPRTESRSRVALQLCLRKAIEKVFQLQMEMHPIRMNRESCCCGWRLAPWDQVSPTGVH